MGRDRFPKRNHWKFKCTLKIWVLSFSVELEPP